MHEIKIAKYAGAASLAFVAALLAQPARAQAAPEGAASADDIVVTGSRIRRDPTDQDKPIVTVDQGSIAKTGLTAMALSEQMHRSLIALP